jgi:predicted permease
MYESSAFAKRGPWYETSGYRLALIARIPSAAVEQQVVTRATAAYRTIEVRDSTVAVRTGPIIRAVGPMARDPELTVATRLASVSLIVLIIAVANVTNLLLLRAVQRRREIAVRRALGVSGARLYGQLAVESLLVAALGGAMAVVFAVWAGAALRRLVLPRVQWASSAVDLRTVLVVGALAILVGFLASLAPAFRAMQTSLADSLKAGTRDGGYHQSRLRSFLLIVQAALAVVLLVGAGLFMRSLDNVRSIDLGYEPDNLAIVRPVFADAGQHDAEMKALFPQVAERLRGIDGVEAVGYTSIPPLQGARFRWIPRLPDRDSLPAFGGDIGPSEVGASPDYFRAVGLRITAGRAFSTGDGPGAPKAVIVSETMARLYWPGQSPLGKCLIIGKRTDPCTTVVGVVADAHRLRMIERKILQFYLPVAQSDETPSDLVIRARAGRMALAMHEADQALRQLVPGLDGTWNRRFSDVIEPQLRPWRLGATLLSALGALALLVAGIGIYSVVAYGVSQRTHEMGIRIALGARMSDILDLVVADGIRAVAIGIGVGVIAALALGQFVASLLFGITPGDPAVLIGAAAVLCGLGLLACIIPGWRAASVDPAVALRTD